MNSPDLRDQKILPEVNRWVLNAELGNKLRDLSSVSNFMGTWIIAKQWMLILLSIYGSSLLSMYYPELTWPIYLLAILIIASRQHCLLALMHEGTHYRLSKSKEWNDFISDFFCALPMGLSTEIYRRQHLEHHLHTNTDHDPYWVGMHESEDWRWPKDHLTTLRIFVQDLSGLAAYKILGLLFLWSPYQKLVNPKLILTPSDRLRLTVFLASFIGVLTAFHLWHGWLVYWFIPMVTVLGALVRIRSVAEHLVLPSEHDLNKSRHVDATVFEKLMIAPINTNFHIAHHLFPSVPFYNLPQLHALLMKSEMYRSRAHITKTYLGLKDGVLGEIIQKS